MSELNLVPVDERDANRRQLVDHFLLLTKQAAKYSDRLVRFPGTMPITFSRRHLDMVSANDYVCLEKSDGTRYMLFTVTDHVLLIDRRMKVYVVDPNPQIMCQGFTRLQDNTILDGELTLNMITGYYEYLIYDVVAIDGDLNIAQLSFRERMQAAEAFVAAPRSWAPFTAGLLRFRVKDFYERNQIRNLFKHILKTPTGQYVYFNNNRRDGVICNETDGVIFVPVKLPYHLKNSTTLLKWKPPHLNSVDFHMSVTPIVDQRRKEPSVRVEIAYKGDGSGVQQLREVHIPFKNRKEFAADIGKYDNSIAEFAYDRACGEWRYMRQREDKDTPNYSSVIINTLETIAEAVEREELVLRMEKTPNPPEDQRDVIEATYRNAAACIFRNDLFDDSNPDYLSTAPISLIPPPNLPIPAGLDHRRRKRDGPKVPNGDSARRREEANTEQTDEQGRLPFVYADDV